jgi:predicted Zn-dependent protease
MTHEQAQDRFLDARVALDEKRPDDALELLAEVLRLGGEELLASVSFRSTRGDALSALERHAEALQDHLAVAELAPESPLVIGRTARALLDAGRGEEALEWALRATRSSEETGPLPHPWVDVAAIAWAAGDESAMWHALAKVAECGGMDIDVMDASDVYDTWSDDPRFEAIFED